MNEEITIRQATQADLARIVRYLHTYWRANHFFVQDPTFLTWQHADPDKSELLTYVLAEQNTLDGTEIIGLLGYIPFHRFDSNLAPDSLSLAIWHVRSDARKPGLGLQILNWIIKNKSPLFIAAIGLSEIVIPIYRAYGYHLKQLHQSAIFNPTLKSTQIASNVPQTALRLVNKNSSIRLEAINQSNGQDSQFRTRIDQLGKTTTPIKSWEYLINRFLKHPNYHYNIYGIYKSNKIAAVIVLRKIKVSITTEFNHIFRIVDMLGPSEALIQAAGALQDLTIEHKCEYIDAMQFGIDPSLLREAGFVDREKFNNLIIPNYFDPFEKKDVTINIAFKHTHLAEINSLRLMRADSDQDRPNQL